MKHQFEKQILIDRTQKDHAKFYSVAKGKSDVRDLKPLANANR